MVSQEEEVIKAQIHSLRVSLESIAKKISFLFSIRQLPKNKTIYYSNLRELIVVLKNYELYILDEILRLNSIEYAIDVNELQDKERLKAIIKYSLLDLFDDPSELIKWTQENFPKFHEIVKNTVKSIK